MEIYWHIKGKYQKIAKDGEIRKATPLKTIINDIQAIATQQKISNVSTINKSFGLNFLPPSIVNNLLEKNLGKSAILINQKIKPSLESSRNFQPKEFDYQFIPEESEGIDTLILASDNQQIPVNLIYVCEGVYQLKLSENQNNPIIKQKRENAFYELNLIIQEQPLTIIDKFLQNPDTENCVISLYDDCIVLLKIEDLHMNLQEAITILKNNSSLTSENLLVKTYRQKYLTLSPINLISSLSDNIMMTDDNQITINKGKHRELLYDLIEKAEKFLLISSYRLEDKDIINLIVNKASSLPLGIWILTDFNDEVIKTVDENVEDKEDYLEYGSSNEKKTQCLQLLAEKGIGFRSGYFHLKTYISEKSAYLGSCNLTGGSLSRNIETGILFSHSPEYQCLINYFNYLWENKSKAQFVPKMGEFQIQNLTPKNISIDFDSCFLNSYQYEEDLTLSLQQFRENPRSKIIIYTRNFKPNGIQANLLKSLSCEIYYGNFNGSDLPAKKIPFLHGKVVILSNEVAYISSQDFTFTHYGLHDLTYKITNLKLIETIKQQLHHLY
ncbi:phospholipase D family protein [Cyanobacterium stanieri LEGE 03274]|uniref:Phospholipase D family protein n=1 Tax=Cyanobacterium stanieri LEGE 03274 TaxID=1828756 RepID=A0ABR9V3E5_9CHRO|nr:phospholipase D family protein [Cyanobacterium stanieri]MBE9222069.1 phospholipase D family protein [Cyanobacterium stanieri LEGE 03274]